MTKVCSKPLSQLIILSVLGFSMALTGCGEDNDSTSSNQPNVGGNTGNLPNLPTADNASSTSCFNPKFYNNGSQWTWDYRHTNTMKLTNAAITYGRTHKLSTKTNQSFMGKNLTEIKLEELYLSIPEEEPEAEKDPSTDDINTVLNYQEIKDGYELLHGQVMPSYNFIDSFEPPRDIYKISMQPNETVRLEDDTMSRTYTGKESITVPAGTFTACVFQDIYDNGNTATLWMIADGKYQGLAAKVIMNTSEVHGVSEMISADVSGLK